MKHFTAMFAFLLLTQAAFSLDYIQLEVWCDLDQAYPGMEEYPLTAEQATGMLLEEVRYVLSLMLYGAQFEYVPGDKRKNVADSITIEPLAMVARGDPSFAAYETRLKQGKLRLIINYRLMDFQIARINGWTSSGIVDITGTGKVDIFNGYADRKAAIDEAVKQGVRAYLRERIFDKPAKVTGSFLVSSPPVVRADSGQFVATLSCQIKIKSVRKHLIY